MRPSNHEVIFSSYQHIRAGKPLPRERFAVVRVQCAGLPNEYHREFWSFDDLDSAKDLSEALVTERYGAHVLDVTTGEKLLDLKARQR